MKITEPSGRRPPGHRQGAPARRLARRRRGRRRHPGRLGRPAQSRRAGRFGSGPGAERRARDGRVHPRHRGHLHVPGRGRGGVRGRHGAGTPPRYPGRCGLAGGTGPARARVRAAVTLMATATPARTLVSRAVIWAGLAVGTCLTVLAVMHGIRVPRLEVVLSVLATWALLTVLAVAAVALLRRHHPAIRHGNTASAAPSLPPAEPAAAPGRLPRGWPRWPLPAGRSASTGP